MKIVCSVCGKVLTSWFQYVEGNGKIMCLQCLQKHVAEMVKK